MKAMKNPKVVKRAAGGNWNAVAAGLAAIEALERRRLLTSVVVNSISDTATGAVTLRDAISIANSSTTPTTVTFASAVFGSAKTIKLNGTQLELKAKEPVTITGPSAGVVISGNGKSRVFLVDAGVKATFVRLTITDGHAPSPDINGGTAEGGGIENAGTLSLTHCTVTGNTAAGDTGPGIGGGIASSGPLTLQNSTVSSNSASAGVSYNRLAGNDSAGGGIYSTASVTISDSTIAHNSSTASGPADLFSNANGADATGGGIYVSGPLSVTASTISTNTAKGGIAQAGNGGAGLGGGIYSGSSATLTSTTVTGNTATGGSSYYYGPTGGSASGGGIYGSSLVITQSTISDNRAAAAKGTLAYGPASGGGVFSSKSLTLELSTVSGNAALDTTTPYTNVANGAAGGDCAGGGVYASETLFVLESTIASNSATGGPGDPQDISTSAGPGGNGSGGGLFCSGAAALTNSTISENAAIGGGGGDADYGGPGANGGNGVGGGIDSVGTLKLINTTVSGNTASAGPGGSGFVQPPDISYPGGAAGAAIGGGLTVTAGTVLAENSILSGNNSGGAADVAGSLLHASSHDLIGTGGGLTAGVNRNQVGVTKPKLSALGNNGGPTQTMVPLAGSPAIDAGSNALAAAAGLYADQRGLPRISGGKVDIGAVEVQAAGGASISGTIFNDLNHDGVHEANEPGLAGWQVYIDPNNSGVYDGGDITTFTTSIGGYKFTGLAAGTYRIREVRLSGWVRTKPPGAFPLGYYDVTVSANQTVIGNDFGDYLS